MGGWRCALLWLTLAGKAAAQELPGDPVAGEALAARWCAECHETRAGIREPSLIEAPGGGQPELVEVPAFQAVADDVATTETALRAFLQTPHPNMPSIRLRPRDTDDLVAYLLDLKRGRRSGT